ncbi:hypothetical protein Dimus_021052 [Dionaea muscipula]
MSRRLSVYIFLNRRNLSTTTTTFATSSSTAAATTATAATAESSDCDETFISYLNQIVRGKGSWKLYLNNPSISQKLKAHHVEKAKLYWPACSVLQTLYHTNSLSPCQVFDEFLRSYRSSQFRCTYGFDLLIKNYVQNRRILDSVTILKCSLQSGVVLEVRTLSAVLHGLVRIRRFNLVVELFSEIANNGDKIQPDVYLYTAVVHSLCELKDIVGAKELVQKVESGGGCQLNLVTYNVLIHGLCKNRRVWEALEVKRFLNQKGLQPDGVTYCTLVLGLCRVEEFGVAVKLIDEMVGLGLVPREAAISGIVDGLRRKGRF